MDKATEERTRQMRAGQGIPCGGGPASTRALSAELRNPGETTSPIEGDGGRL